MLIAYLAVVSWCLVCQRNEGLGPDVECKWFPSPGHEAETVPEACLGYGFGSGTGDLIAGMPHGPMLQASAAESSKDAVSVCKGKRAYCWSKAFAQICLQLRCFFTAQVSDGHKC